MMPEPWKPPAGKTLVPHDKSTLLQFTVKRDPDTKEIYCELILRMNFTDGTSGYRTIPVDHETMQRLDVLGVYKLTASRLHDSVRMREGLYSPDHPLSKR